MQVEINGDVETIIQAGLMAGDFGSAEEAVAVMARVWAIRKENTLGSIPSFAASTDIVALAAKRGVRPFDPAGSPPDFGQPRTRLTTFSPFFATFVTTLHRPRTYRNELAGNRHGRRVVSFQNDTGKAYVADWPGKTLAISFMTLAELEAVGTRGRNGEKTHIETWRRSSSGNS